MKNKFRVVETLDGKYGVSNKPIGDESMWGTTPNIFNLSRKEASSAVKKLNTGKYRVGWFGAVREKGSVYYWGKRIL